MLGPRHQMDHLRSGMNRQGMRGETPSWRNVRGHGAGHVQLGIGHLGKQGDEQIFKRNYTGLQLHQLRVG